MGAGDASWSDAERSNPVRRSIRGVDRRGLRWRPKPGLLIRLWRRRCRDRGLQHAPNGVPRHQRAPGVGLWAPHSTRLVTRVERTPNSYSPRTATHHSDTDTTDVETPADAGPGAALRPHPALQTAGDPCESKPHRPPGRR